MFPTRNRLGAWDLLTPGWINLDRGNADDENGWALAPLTVSANVLYIVLGSIG